MMRTVKGMRMRPLVVGWWGLALEVAGIQGNEAKVDRRWPMSMCSARTSTSGEGAGWPAKRWRWCVANAFSPALC